MPQIFVTPEGKSVQVADEHAEEAQKQGLEPAMVMADPKGKSAIVKASNLRQAQQAGLVPQQEWDIKQSNKTDLDPGALESAGRGFANAATLGFADEIAGAGNAVKTAGKKILSGNLPSVSDIAGGYERGRNEYRNIDDAAWENNPWTYGLSAVAPTLATGALSKGAAALKAGKAALQGGVQSAIGSSGGGTDAEGQADLLKNEYKKFATQVGVGGLLGGVLSGGVAKIAPEVAEWLSKKSAERATKAVADQSMKAQKNIKNLPGGADAFGKDARDLGIVGMRGTKGMLNKAEQIQDRAGKEIGATYQKLDDLNKENSFAPKEYVWNTLNKAAEKIDEIANKLQENAETRVWSKPALEYADELKQDVMKFAQREVPMTFEELNRKKSALGKIAFPESGNSNELKDVFKQFKNIMTDAMVEDAGTLAEKAGDKTIISNLAKSNRDYSVATTAQKALAEKALREAKNRSLSPTDYFSGGVLGSTGAFLLGPKGAALALAGAGANKLGRTYGNQALSLGTDKISQAIQNNPQLLNYLAAKTGKSIEELLRGN